MTVPGHSHHKKLCRNLTSWDTKLYLRRPPYSPNLSASETGWKVLCQATVNSRNSIKLNELGYETLYRSLHTHRTFYPVIITSSSKHTVTKNECSRLECWRTTVSHRHPSPRTNLREFALSLSSRPFSRNAVKEFTTKDSGNHDSEQPRRYEHCYKK